MYYVQYFEKGMVTGKLIEACGDRAVFILDGRNNLKTMINDAIRFNGYRRPVYKAFQIFKGQSFTRSKPITDIISLEAQK